MFGNRKKTLRSSIGILSAYRSSSIHSNGGVSVTVDDDSEKEPLLERMLSLKLDDELFNCINEDENDDDLISVLEFPFSDDEDDDESPIRQPLKVEELQKILDDETNAFSKEYLDILDEIDAEKGPFSLPCSSCSLCSSCTTDTWDRLEITDECLQIKPTPLDAEEIEELNKVKNEHDESINTLLSNIKMNDEDIDERSSTSSMNKQEFDNRRLSAKDLHIRKESINTYDDAHQYHFESSEHWTDSLTNYDDFFITPFDYDYYQDIKALKTLTEKDTIPWSVKEKSKNKCIKWLDNYHF